VDIPEKRVISSLLLLVGFSFLIAGLYSGQVALIVNFMKSVFPPAVAGMP
jgi:membrane-bound ClpP family serine protease